MFSDPLLHPLLPFAMPFVQLHRGLIRLSVLRRHLRLQFSDQCLHLLQAISDKALGGLMIFVAIFVFVYYTVWALLLVSFLPPSVKYIPFDSVG